MPYFERKPYDEMIREAAAAPAAAAAGSAAAPGETPIVEIARGILDAEARGRHAVDGPFACAAATPPGGTGTIVLSIAATQAGGPLAMRFEPCGLTGPGGAELGADLLSVAPATLRLRPGEAQDVTVTLSVPDLAAPGRYHGRIDGFGDERTAIVVSFDVAGDGA